MIDTKESKIKCIKCGKTITTENIKAASCPKCWSKVWNDFGNMTELDIEWFNQENNWKPDPRQ